MTPETQCMTISPPTSFPLRFPQSSFGMHSSFLSAATTSFLFIKSDLLSIVIPMIFLGAGYTASPASIPSWIASIHWTMAHLLQFCISNQLVSIAEDQMNKPWRPLPSKRISVDNATRLWRILAVWCLAIGWYHGTTSITTVIIATTWLYNNLGGHSQWFVKNSINVVGYMAFQLGATTVLHGSKCTQDLIPASLTIGAVVLTTIHTSDFPDVDGDRVLGRTTLPIQYPKASRFFVFIALLTWTMSTCFAWPTQLASEAFLCFGGYVASRILFQRTKGADKITCYLYYIWLAGMHYVEGRAHGHPISSIVA